MKDDFFSSELTASPLQKSLPTVVLSAVLTLFTAVLTGQSHASTPEADTAPTGHDTFCQVNVASVIGPVQKDLFGTNVEWFNRGNGLIKPNSELDLNVARLAREEGVSLVRFPGGTFSDYYHWTDGIGPIGQRPVRKHFTDPGSSPNIFGTPELSKFCQASGAKPLITVNVGTGTAEEAAAWVRYCNAPDNPQRSADGLSQPLGVQLWEVGNELYLPGNPGEVKVGISPEVYTSRFLEFAARMREVDPQIKLIGIGVAPANEAPVERLDWSEILLKNAANEMDYIAVHNSYFPMLIVDKGLPVRQVYQAMWAGPEAVDRSLSSLEKLIAKYEQKRKIGIAITEWGALFSFDRDIVDHGKTMGTGVYVARMLQVYLQHPKVRLANYFKLFDRTPMGWISFAGVPKVPYYALQLMTQHFGSVVVQSVTQSAHFTSPELRVMHSEKAVPEVTSCAALDATGKTLYVNLVSRSWETTHRVQIELLNFHPSGSMVVGWILSAPSATDNNGSDLPPDWTIPYQEPTRSPGGGLIQIRKITVDLSQPIVLAPFTVLNLEIPGSKL